MVWTVFTAVKPYLKSNRSVIHLRPLSPNLILAYVYCPQEACHDFGANYQQWEELNEAELLSIPQLQKQVRSV